MNRAARGKQNRHEHPPAVSLSWFITCASLGGHGWRERERPEAGTSVEYTYWGPGPLSDPLRLISPKTPCVLGQPHAENRPGSPGPGRRSQDRNPGSALELWKIPTRIGVTLNEDVTFVYAGGGGGVVDGL